MQLPIERYQAITGEQRVRLSLELHEFACSIAREGIRHPYPEATPQGIEQHLRRRIQLSRR